MLKARHWPRNVHWEIVVVKSFGGSIANCSDGNYRGLTFSPVEAKMENESLVTPINKQFCLPNLLQVM